MSGGAQGRGRDRRGGAPARPSRAAPPVPPSAAPSAPGVEAAIGAGGDDPEGMVCVGAVAGAFGVRGEVRLKSFCAAPEAIAGYGPLRGSDGRDYAVTLTRPVAGGLGARLSGVPTREAAEALRGLRLFAARARLPRLPDDEFYHADLLGLEVIDTGGAVLGRVKAVHDFGAGDVLELARPGAAAVMLPFTRAAVPTVDLAAGRIVADPPAGLFGDEADPDPGGAPEAPA